MPVMPRVQAVVIPLLRAAPGLDGVTISSWVPDIDYREFPLINIRRVGGTRHGERPDLLDKTVIEMTCYTTTGLPDTETLYSEALEALYDAVLKQTQTDAGYLHSIKETMGMTQFSSLFMDSWRVQGLIALGVRPPRST